MLTLKQNSIRISFGYIDCPSCRSEMNIDYSAPGLSTELQKCQKLKVKVVKMALKYAKAEGLDKRGPVVTQGDPFYRRPLAYAMKQCTFYECAKCLQPFFGGMMDCAEAMNVEKELDRDSLECKACVMKEMGIGEDFCKNHGNKYIDWKCQQCCSLAVWTCGGSYFCSPCHNNYMTKTHIPFADVSKCKGGPACPLGIEKHPMASSNHRLSKFALGCSICRSENLDQITDASNNE